VIIKGIRSGTWPFLVSVAILVLLTGVSYAQDGGGATTWGVQSTAVGRCRSRQECQAGMLRQGRPARRTQGF